MLKILSSKLAASPGSLGWVQVYAFASSDIEKKQTRGHLFVVIASKKGQVGIEAISTERQIASRIRLEYFINQQGKAFDALKESVQKIVDEFGKTEKGLEIACCSFVNDVVYSVAFGGGKVLIKRNGVLALILESKEQVISASGFPKSNDVIIAGTQSFFNRVQPETLKESLSTENIDEAIESLTPLIYGGTGNETAGATILEFVDENIAQNITLTSKEKLKENILIHAPKIPVNFYIKQKFQSLFKSLKLRFPKKEIYVRAGIQDEAISQSRKITVSVGLVLLIVLAVSIGFGMRQKKINAVKSQYQVLLSQAVSEVDQAISLASSNPEESRNLFRLSEEKMNKIDTLKIKDSKVDELRQKIKDSRASILGEYDVTPELFLDLGLLSSGFKGEELSTSGGNIYVLDKSGARVVSIAIDTKKSKVVAGPAVIDNPLGLATYDDNVYILFSDGIYRVGTSKSKLIDKTWGGEAYIYAFAGNLYVLDKNNDAIYRYAGENGDAFGSQQNWLSASTKANFSNSIAWGMNGAIYVLYPNSKILKYSLGSPQNFSLTGISPEIGNIDAIYADSDNNFVYLLDRTGKRVVAVDRNGKYKAQYISDQIENATKLVVSESAGKIILLTGDKLLSVSLQGI